MPVLPAKELLCLNNNADFSFARRAPRFPHRKMIDMRRGLPVEKQRALTHTSSQF